MSKRDRERDPDRGRIESADGLRIREQDDHAAGVKAVAVSMKRSLAHMGRGGRPRRCSGSTRPRVSTA